MSKEKEIVLAFRDVLNRVNVMADAVTKTPADMNTIHQEAESYKEKEIEYKNLLSLPAKEVTSNFMFKMMYSSFSATMLDLVKLVSIYHNNLITFYGKDDKLFGETVADICNFRKQCNEKFKKVEKQLSAVGNVD